MISIDYNTITENAKKIKQRIGNGRLCAVVKSNAYGHGLMDTVQCLEGIADVFAVDETADALQIVPRPTLMLVPVQFKDCCTLIENGVMLTVDSFDTFSVVESAAREVGKSAVVHVKLDTGMCRLGFITDEADDLVCRLSLCNCIEVAGIYSHLSCADSDPEFTANQLNTFLKLAEQIKCVFPDAILHISNTDGLKYPQCRLDMVRVGIGLYGYGLEGVIPAKSCSARVIAVKSILPDSRVGYGGTLSDAKKLAIVKLGYANGYARINKSVGGGWYDGKFLPIVGNVCMGMMMLDATDIKIDVGCWVEILSPQHIAIDNQQIVYELLCNLR